MYRRLLVAAVLGLASLFWTAPALAEEPDAVAVEQISPAQARAPWSALPGNKPFVTIEST
jgi:hypothetical protein